MTTQSMTWGADPEFFLTTTRDGDSVTPIVGLLGGTKSEPRMLGAYGVQEDNVMAEFTVPPEPNLSRVLTHADRAMSLIFKDLRTRSEIRGYVYPSSSFLFEDRVLRDAGPQAMMFGCSPDFNAYEMGAPWPRVDPAALVRGNHALRFAGGHIHIGYKEVRDLPEYVACMFCDATFGLWLVMSGEAQMERRQLYGMAGRYRPTPYGLEYRTPSNAWLYNDALRDALLGAEQQFVRIMRRDPVSIHRLFNEIPWPDVRAAINDEDVRRAVALVDWITQQ